MSLRLTTGRYQNIG